MMSQPHVCYRSHPTRSPSWRHVVPLSVLASFLLVSCNADEAGDPISAAPVDLSGPWRGTIFEACDIPEEPNPEFALELEQDDSVIIGTVWIKCGGRPDSIGSGTWEHGVLSFRRDGSEVDYEFSGSLVYADRLEGTYRILSTTTGQRIHSAGWYAERIRKEPR